MGCVGSQYDDMPVTGAPGEGLVVLPGGQKYVLGEQTVLKLKENFWSFSGDDATIKDITDTSWFKVKGTVMSLSGKRTMTDCKEGTEICGYQKKLLSMHATAYITVQSGEQTMVLATIKKQFMVLESSADIFIHKPMVPLDNVTTEGMVPDIHVAGDIISKKYDFMMGNLETNPYKIAQVVRKWTFDSERNTYFVNIGTKVDIAFIAMSVIAIDEIFSDN